MNTKCEARNFHAFSFADDFSQRSTEPCSIRKHLWTIFMYDFSKIFPRPFCAWLSWSHCNWIWREMNPKNPFQMDTEGKFCGKLRPETEWWIMKKMKPKKNLTDVNFHKHIFSAFAFHVPFFWFAAIFKGDFGFVWIMMENEDGLFMLFFWGFIGANRMREKKSLGCQIQATWFIIIIHDSTQNTVSAIQGLLFSGTISLWWG